MANKNKKAKRIIKQAKISFLSLCPRGMNEIQTVFKSADGGSEDIKLSTLVVGKMTELGEVTAVVYAPDMVDGEGDTASAQVIKEFAYDFAANGVGVDIRHNNKALPTDDVYVAETFLIQKNDPRFVDTKDYDGNSVDVTGGWGVVLKVESEELRTLYRDEEWGGISMGGLMQVKEASEDAGVKNILKSILSAINLSKTKDKLENTMLNAQDKKDVAELVVSTMAEVTKAAKEEAEKTQKAADDKDKSKKGMGYIKPVLKDNPTDEEEAQHEKNMRIFGLSKEVDTSDLDSLNKFQLLRKKIISGEDISVDVDKSDKNRPYSAFTTNQDNAEIVKSGVSNNDDPIGDNILAQMAKEKKEATAVVR